MPRFNFQLGEKGTEALERIRYLTDRGTKAEVIRDALALYEHLVDRVKAGERIYMGRSQNSTVELVVTTLESVRRNVDSPLGEPEPIPL